jgi:hypothetical protein
MWYYIIYKDEYGPVSDDRLLELYENHSITERTLVRKEPSKEWILFRDSGLCRPLVMHEASFEKLKETFRKTMTLMFFCVIWEPFRYIILPFATDSPFAWGVVLMTALCVFSLLAIVGNIYQYILLYRYWQGVQDENSRVSPGKAVGFLFIPLFNYYWMFKAYWGLSKQANVRIEKLRLQNPRIDLHKSREWLSFAYSLLPLLSLGTLPFFIKTYPALFTSMESVTSTITSEQYFALLGPLLIDMMFQWVLSYTLLIWMYIDLYRSISGITRAARYLPIAIPELPKSE